MANRIELTGQILETSGLRFTPAGVATVQMRLAHGSEQSEAGRLRQVVCEVEAIAFGETARKLSQSPIGVQLSVTGFLDRKSPRSSLLTLHVTDYELI
ncbi:MAG: primosomal replication protein N [Hydrogenophilaceae bacterium]|nr:primosomal replication protein N [Hydrogenophilaceae bacterium]